jgi:hypothetical protein
LALRLLSSQDIKRAPIERKQTAYSTINWNEVNLNVLSVFNESPHSTSDTSNEGSPYMLMDNILWGTQHVSSY